MIVGIQYLGEPASIPPRQVTPHGKTVNFDWQECEAWPGGAYYWKTFDDRLRLAELAGFRDHVVTLRSKHVRSDMVRPTVTPPAEIAALAYAQASAPPVPDWGRYWKWVRAVALRYQGRVSAYQIESEMTDETHWLGTDAEYVSLFREAEDAVRGMALVVLGGIGFGDLLDDCHPSDDVETIIAQRIATWPEPFRSMGVRSLGFGVQVLGSLAPDAVCLHSLSSATGIEPGVALLRFHSLTPRPVWVDDATSAPLALYDPRGFNQPADGWTMFTDLLGLIAKNPAAIAKRERAQADMVAAKIAAARECGVERIYFGTLTDWPLIAATGALAFQGLRKPALDVVRAAQ